MTRPLEASVALAAIALLAAAIAFALGDLGNGADLCVLPFVARNQEDAFLVAHVGGDRYVHVREDDDVVERN